MSYRHNECSAQQMQAKPGQYEMPMLAEPWQKRTGTPKALFCRLLSLFLIMLLGSVWSLQATTFNSAGAGLPGVKYGEVAWGDYDNDGHLDVLLTGITGADNNFISRIYHNVNGEILNANVNLTGVCYSSADWGDYDNDGDLDILLAGATLSYNPWGAVTKVYRNDNGSFVDIGASIQGVYKGSVCWIDYDNDGSQDVLVTGFGAASTPISRLYHNEAGVFSLYNAGLTGATTSCAACADYDGDSDIDIAIGGVFTSPYQTVLYDNDWGNFIDTNAGLEGVIFCGIAWNDYDNDGELDLLVTGSGITGIEAKLYHNSQGTLTYTQNGIGNVAMSAVAWGDYDNDGLSDVTIAGSSADGAIHDVFRNNSGLFEAQNFSMQGIIYPAVKWGDYNSDGCLDILSCGQISGGYAISSIYRNEGTPADTLPSVPDILVAYTTEDYVVFLWEPSTDAETPQGGLSYALRIGSSPGECDVVSPMSDPNGQRLLPAPGYINSGCTWKIRRTAFDPDQWYYWSVQAIDGALAGSAFALEQRFSINPISAQDEINANCLRVRAFPNPCDSEVSFVINNPVKQPGTLKIYNIKGQEMYSTAVNPAESKQTLTWTARMAGVYIWKLTDGTQVSTGKLFANGKCPK